MRWPTKTAACYTRSAHEVVINLAEPLQQAPDDGSGNEIPGKQRRKF